jgi:DNA primase catalytic subunit
MYYLEIFKQDELIEIVGLDYFPTLEISCAGFPKFVYDDGKKVIDPKTKKPKVKVETSRKVCMDKPSELGLWLSDYNYYGVLKGPANVAYYGATYYNKFTQNSTPADMIWKKKDFGIDIDIDGSTKIRQYLCNCVGKTICDGCIEILNEASRHGIVTLHKDFGFDMDRLNAFWSGREGMHIHYKDYSNLDSKNREYIDQQLRRKVINYLTIAVEELKPNLNIKKSQAKPDDFIVKMLKPVENKKYTIKSDNLRKRIQNDIVYYFFKYTSLDKMLRMEWYEAKDKLISDKDGLKRILERLKSFVLEEKVLPQEYKFFNQNPFTEVYTKQGDNIHKDFYSKFRKLFGLDYHYAFENIIKYRYPRYDVNVSIDTRRLFKIPNTIDARTDKCYLIQRIPLNDILKRKFSLDQLQTLNDKIIEYHQ